MAAQGQGTRKIFWAWAVDKVNPGGGTDTTLQRGGYFLDENVSAGSYPNTYGSAITSQNQAYSQCVAFVRRFQSMGIDARGRLFYKVFGQDATNPTRAFSGMGTADVECGRVDVPEAQVGYAIRLANKPIDDGTTQGTPPDMGTQDLDGGTL